MPDTIDSMLRAAIRRTKGSDRVEVEPDDVLAACLLAVARFGIARIGPLVIDLEALGIDWMVVPHGEAAVAKKVAYSEATVALLDRAAAISRVDQAAVPRLAHLLAALATQEPQGLMANLATNGIDSAAWRAALADFDVRTETGDGGTVDSGTYVSPEQAAEILGVHHQTIRGYIRSGKLPALRIAGERAVRIRRESLDRLLEPVANQEAD